MSSRIRALGLLAAALIAGCAGTAQARPPIAPSLSPVSVPTEPVNTPIIVTLPPVTPAPTVAPSRSAVASTSGALDRSHRARA